MKINETIIAPLLTEKGTNLARSQVYMFLVNSKASKSQVKKALETLYPVKVSSVRTIVRKGKKVKRGRKMIVKKLSDEKIAYVKLKEGKLDIFPQT